MRGVFDSVASRYDLMNDLMSLGLHRAWKAYTVAVASAARGRPRARHRRRHRRPGARLRAQGGHARLVVHTDINEAMLRRGRDRLLDEGLVLPTALCDAETLPFAADSFDLVSVAFGLRNMTHKDRALAEMAPRAAPGRAPAGAGVLEGRRAAGARPTTGTRSRCCRDSASSVAGDADSYRYLAESIRMHPDQAELKAMMKEAGFGHVDVHNLSAGVVALHVGIKC